MGENQYHCILGGNMCFIVHPSDIAPALVALGATALITGPKGTRDVKMENFFVLPEQNMEKETVLDEGEIVSGFILPPSEQGQRSSYRKVRERQSWDFALAGVALAITFSNKKVHRARIVLSGAAPVPWRSMEAEKVILGQTLDKQAIVEAAKAALKNADPLEHNGYKIELFRGIIEESLALIGTG